MKSAFANIQERVCNVCRYYVTAGTGHNKVQMVCSPKRSAVILYTFDNRHLVHESHTRNISTDRLVANNRTPSEPSLHRSSYTTQTIPTVRYHKLSFLNEIKAFMAWNQGMKTKPYCFITGWLLDLAFLTDVEKIAEK